LEILIKKYPDTLYGLLYSLVGNRHDTAFHTPRPKWRLFSELREIRVTQREVYYMRGFCIDNIIEMSKDNVKRILALIDLLDDMEWDRIDKALNTIETSADFEEDKKQIYHKFRKFIGNHRSYPTAHWALTTDILDKIEQTALKFKSENDILNESYLFEEHHPEFIEGRQGNDFDKQAEEILSRRLEFIEAVLDKYGIDKIFELASKIEHPYLYGNVLASSDKINQIDKLAIYKLIESEDNNLLALVGAFIRISENRTDLQTQTDVLDGLIKSGLSTQG